jgi:hypothetical protein
VYSLRFFEKPAYIQGQHIRQADFVKKMKGVLWNIRETAIKRFGAKKYRACDAYYVPGPAGGGGKSLRSRGFLSAMFFNSRADCPKDIGPTGGGGKSLSNRGYKNPRFLFVGP